MKLSKIAMLCKREKSIALLNDPALNGTQFLGTDSALYRVDGLPELDKDVIFALFDIPEDKQDEYNFRMLGMSYQDVRDLSPTDVSAHRVGFPIMCQGILLRQYSKAIPSEISAFLDETYLAPFTDERKPPEIYLRGGAEDPIFAVKTGLILRALVFPAPVESQPFIESINEMSITVNAKLECRRRMGMEE